MRRQMVIYSDKPDKVSSAIRERGIGRRREVGAGARHKFDTRFGGYIVIQYCPEVRRVCIVARNSKLPVVVQLRRDRIDRTPKRGRSWLFNKQNETDER